MNTKQKILDESLTLFSKKGYRAVSVGDIAKAVGIKAPSLYKHYKSKQDIFDAILYEMKHNYDKQAAKLNMTGNDVNMDIRVFTSIAEDELVAMGISLFLYFLKDAYVSKFRKMLTIEQFHNTHLSELFSQQYIDEPLAYQTGLFTMLSTNETLKPNPPSIMALQFYAPIFMLLTVCDRQPDREKEILEMIEQHIRQFSRLYNEGGETKCI